MQKTALGRTGLQISPLVFGGNVFGWTADTRMSHRLIDRFLERGFDCIDTADVYSRWAEGNSGGDSERVIGEWVRETGRRDEIVLMTKVGMWPERPGLSEANIVAACEASLDRLGTDRIDVYFAHRDDPETPLDETLGAFERLRRDGKILHAGASNYEADRLEAAMAAAQASGMTGYEVLQPEYNLASRGYEEKLRTLALRHGLGVTPYFSLASGFLTGKYRSKDDAKGADREAMVGGYFDGKGPAILDVLLAVARERDAAPAQVALAWLIAKDGVSAPIASARDLEQLDATLGAAEISLAPEEMQRLDAAGA